jgi:hypothetical protein
MQLLGRKWYCKSMGRTNSIIALFFRFDF